MEIDAKFIKDMPKLLQLPLDPDKLAKTKEFPEADKLGKRFWIAVCGKAEIPVLRWVSVGISELFPSPHQPAGNFEVLKGAW